MLKVKPALIQSGVILLHHCGNAGAFLNHLQIHAFVHSLF